MLPPGAQEPAQARRHLLSSQEEVRAVPQGTGTAPAKVLLQRNPYSCLSSKPILQTPKPLRPQETAPKRPNTHPRSMYLPLSQSRCPSGLSRSSAKLWSSESPGWHVPGKTRLASCDPCCMWLMAWRSGLNPPSDPGI